MLCERCNMLPAAMEVSSSSLRGTRTKHLCRYCADALLIPPADPQIPLRDRDILESLLQPEVGRECTRCGSGLDQVLQTGLLGCEHCLDDLGHLLAEHLLPAEQRIDHTLEPAPYYRGPLPRQLAQLRDMLNGRDLLHGQDPQQGRDPAAVFRQIDFPDFPLSFPVAAVAAAAPSSAWHSQRGPADDVVLYTRAATVRSPLAVPFGVAVSPETLNSAAAAVAVSVADTLQTYPLRLDEPRRRMLREQRVLGYESVAPQFIVTTPGAYGDTGVEVCIGGSEQLSSCVLQPGLQPAAAITRAEAVMQTLERTIPCRARIDFGYITQPVATLGLGLRLSAELHLWALRQFDAGHAAVHESCPDAVRTHFLPGGRVYLEVVRSLGLSAAEMQELLEGAVVALVHYERKARADMLQHRAREWKDLLNRHVREVLQSDFLSQESAEGLFSVLRSGVLAGFWPELTLERLNTLSVLARNAHLQYAGGESWADEPWSRIRCNHVRSQLVRSELGFILKIDETI